MPRLSLRRVFLVGGVSLALLAAASAYGLATSLPLTSHSLAATSVSVPRCPTTGTTVLENVAGTNITSVTVGAIDATCAGGTLSLTVYNGTATGSGSAIVPAGGGTLTVTLGSAVAFVDNARVDLVVTGP